MTNVRRISFSTVSVIVFLSLIVLLRYCIKQYWVEGFYMFENALSSKKQIGAFHAFILSFSFWILIASSLLNAIYSERKGIYVIKAFLVPLLFSVGIAVLIYVLKSTYVEVRWFWFLYYAGMTVGLRVSFNKVSNPTNTRTSRIIPFLKDYLHRNNTSLNPVDYHVLRFSRIVVAGTFLVMVLSFIAYCINNRDLFMNLY